MRSRRLAAGLLCAAIALQSSPASARRAPRRIQLKRNTLKLNAKTMRLRVGPRAAREITLALDQRQSANGTGGEVRTLRAMVHLLRALKAHDAYTHGHAIRVGRYAMATAKALGLDAKSVNTVSISAKLHDIGKMGVSRRVINGTSGKLTRAKRMMFSRHPATGVALLEPFAKAKPYVAGVLTHHENVDGTGYPLRIGQEKIPLVGRIIAVADAFDAMTSARTYNKPMGQYAALAQLKRLAGKKFDTQVVTAFIKAIKSDPHAKRAINDARTAR